MSTSDTQAQQSSGDTPQATQARPPLRVLAPKLLPVARSSSRKPVVFSSLPYRADRLPKCLVCSRRGCQLTTHRAFIAQSSRRRSLAPSSDVPPRSPGTSLPERLRKSQYTRSYAYYCAKVFVDVDITSSRVDPFFDLPLSDDVNNPEMRLLFYQYFSIESDRCINLPRPPELPSDTMLSPFFLPALNDSALCLAILAASAALISQRSGLPAENVAVLTLFDKAMYQLRERLNAAPGKVSDATVATATFLWGINSLLNDPESMQLHGKSVHALVSGRGGLSNLGLSGAVARLVVMMDSLNAIIFGEHALYPNESDTTPLENEPAPLCGAYFRSPRSQQSIDPALKEICYESVVVANLVESMICKRSTTLEYFYATSKLSSIGTDTVNVYVRFMGTGSRDECLCLAMQLVNILLYYRPREQQMMVTTLSSRLIRALHQQEIPGYWVQEMELLVWILFIVAMILTNLMARSGPWTCFARRFAPNSDLKRGQMTGRRQCVELSSTSSGAMRGYRQDLRLYVDLLPFEYLETTTRMNEKPFSAIGKRGFQDQTFVYLSPSRTNFSALYPATHAEIRVRL